MSKQPTALAERRELDLAFMQAEAKWPQWPLLPVKRRDGNMNSHDFCGLLFDSMGPVVYFGNLFMLPKGGTWIETLNAMQSRRYASLADLADDYTVD